MNWVLTTTPYKLVYKSPSLAGYKPKFPINTFLFLSVFDGQSCDRAKLTKRPKVEEELACKIGYSKYEAFGPPHWRLQRAAGEIDLHIPIPPEVRCFRHVLGVQSYLLSFGVWRSRFSTVFCRKTAVDTDILLMDRRNPAPPWDVL